MLRAAGFGLAYFALAKLSFSVSGLQDNILSCWLPSGLFLGVLLLTERRHWLGLILAGGLGDLAYNFLGPSPWTLRYLLLAHLGNSASAVMGAWLVRRFVGERPSLESVREFIGLLVFGGLLSLPLSATIGVLVTKAADPPADWLLLWGHWYSSDLLGVLLLTPVLLAWREGVRWPATWRLTPHFVEAAGLCLGTVATLSAAYYFQWPKLILPLFLAIPYVVWASFRFGLRGSSLIILFSLLVAQWFIDRGYGMVGNNALTVVARNVEMLVYIGGFSLLGLFPAVVLAEQRRTAAKLQSSEARLRAIFDHAPECVKVVAPDGLLLEMNPAGLRMIEADSLAEMQGRSVYSLIAEEHRTTFRTLHHKVLRGESGALEFDIIGLKGTRRSLETHATPLRDAAGAITAVLGVTRDITARKRAESNIREQADLLNQTRDAIMVADLSNRFTFWNEGAERITGWPAAETKGQTAELAFGPNAAAQLAVIRKAVMTTGAWHGELPIRHKDGRTVILDLRVALVRDAAGQPKGRLSIATDITEKKQMEEQLLRGQRLESLGLLAAGIAHDLNNILSPVLMAAPLLRTRATHPFDLRVLDLVEKSAQRGGALVRQILSFARGVEGEKTRVQPAHLLHEIGALISDTFPKTIRLETEVAPDLRTVLVNPTQLHQILLNLCINARDAMPGGGTLSLRARNASGADAPAGRPPGDYLVLEVADTGTGMTPEVLAHIWESFFTTKGDHRGTGLGLATVRGIVNSLQGGIDVDSAPGYGSTFRLWLPAAKDVSVDPFNTRPDSLFPLPGQGELVLVVDDEAAVRELITQALTAAGYRTLSARDGGELFALHLTRLQEVSLVLMDIGLPDQDGLSLAKILQRARPDQRILFITGYTDSPEEASRTLPTRLPLLKKPFTGDELLGAVQRALRTPGLSIAGVGPVPGRATESGRPPS